jgi:hypothetical protein
MLLDALTNLSDGQSLTGISAGATGVSNVLDLLVSRDISTNNVPVFVIFTTAPTSATGGATINIAIQTSADNSTYVTLEETAAQPIANITSGAPFAFRGSLPAGVLRYLRIAYTPSAVLTAGTVTASIGGDFSVYRAYPRNYVA